MRLCCKTSWKALLRFSPPTKKNFARQVRKWVVKRATSLINSFCRNVANQVPHFVLALYKTRKFHRVAHFLLLRIIIFAMLVVSFTNHKNSKALHQPATNKEQRYSDVGSHVFLRPISVRILNAICKNRTN